MSAPCVLLVDNGSRRAAATLALRRLAGALGERAGLPVEAVSLQHADHIPAAELDDQPADVFADFVDRRLRAGQREFVVVPLFFGQSRALTSFVPQQLEPLRAMHGDFRVDVADVLLPLPGGEPRLAGILADNVHAAANGDLHGSTVIVVDHGSPLPQVNAVRRQVAEDLLDRLPAGVAVEQAVMERRSGAAYDFNGELLEDVLEGFAAQDARRRVVLAMLFLLPGRHAGQGGDIAGIAAAAMARHPGLRVDVSRLVAEHPLLVDILYDRLADRLPAA